MFETNNGGFQNAPKKTTSVTIFAGEKNNEVFLFVSDTDLHSVRLHWDFFPRLFPAE